jgi:hypothetical protein
MTVLDTFCYTTLVCRFTFYERKNDKLLIEKYPAAVRPSQVEGQAKRIFVTRNGSNAYVL